MKGILRLSFAFIWSLGAVKLWLSRFGILCGLLFCLFGGIACQATNSSGSETVRVVRVASGQTIEVLDASGQNPLAQKVRLIGIVAPDWDQQKTWSLEAKQQLEALIGADKTVRLEFDLQPQVTHNETIVRLAYVWKGQGLLNEKLVEGGYVLASSRSPNLKYEQRLTYAQEKARLTGAGIWNAENPLRQDPEEL